MLLYAAISGGLVLAGAAKAVLRYGWRWPMGLP